MKKRVGVLIALTATLLTSCSKKDVSQGDIYCLQCADAAGNDLPIRVQNTKQWAKENSGPGKTCYNYYWKEDHTCP